MSQKGLEQTPFDALTKLPLPIFPKEEVPDFQKQSTVANWHHTFHPSDSHLLTTTDGLVIRNARLQRVDIPTHDEYHAQYVGPPLPETSEQRFEAAVWALAGYVPEEGLELGKEGFEKKLIPTELRSRLQSSGEFKISAADSLVKFLRRYVARQDLSHVNESVVEEFLTTQDVEIRLRLGQCLLGLAAEKACDSLTSVYQAARKESLIAKHARRQKLSRFVLGRLGNLQQRHNFAMQLRRERNWPLNVYHIQEV